MLIGALLSMSLWGVTCVQTYEYFLTNTDRLFQRSIIAVLWVVDTISSAMDCNMIYYLVITNFGNPYGYLTPPWGMLYHGLVAGVTNVIIRTMFAQRIYKFSGQNVILTSWVMGITIADFVISIVSTYNGLHIDTVPLATIARYIYVSLSLGFLADVSVTVALCWLLQSAKTGFNRSNTLVNILMIYTVNTGFLVTIDAMVVLITFTLFRNTMVFYLFTIWLNKLYFNAYLASLNAREKLRGTSSLSMPLSRLETPSHTASGGRISQVNDAKTHEQRMSITLQTTIDRRVDDVDRKLDVV